jgi:hypothetical protein
MKKLLFILSAAFILVSCKKDAVDVAAVCQDGKIEWKGDPAADGLGWVFTPVTATNTADSSSFYVVRELPQSFQVDQLSVNACLSNTGQKVSCMCLNAPYAYTLVSIRRR